jgi:hypothetical protein
VVFSGGIRAALLSGLIFGGIAYCNAASAETLADALSAAYQGNPTLRGERAKLRATAHMPAN